jgi:hypothetical protein
VRNIYAQGGMRAFYSGLGVSLTSIVPSVAINWAVYEQLKKKIRAHLGSDSMLSIVASGGAAGAASLSLLYPFDLIKRSMQAVSRHAAPSAESKANKSNVRLEGSQIRKQQASVRPTGTIGFVKHLWKSQGIAGFYRGITLGYMKTIPQVAISFCAFEAMKSLMFKTMDTEHERKEWHALKAATHAPAAAAAAAAAAAK